MNSYNKLYFAANLLIDISEDSQKNHQDIKNNGYTSMGWAKELCTIKLTTSKRAGHTSCIEKLAKERFNNNVILVIPFAKALNKLLYDDEEGGEQ